MPIQVWATWFPREGEPQSFIQGFGLDGLQLSARGENPFHFRIGHNGIEENSCRGALEVDGHKVSWDLRYRSTFCVTLSNKGWIGFSQSPHSDALFAGRIALDGRSFAGDPLVKSSFFKVRRFHDEEDLRQQLRDWHREVNQERPCRATGIIPAGRHPA